MRRRVRGLLTRLNGLEAEATTPGDMPAFPWHAVYFPHTATADERAFLAPLYRDGRADALPIEAKLAAGIAAASRTGVADQRQ